MASSQVVVIGMGVDGVAGLAPGVRAHLARAQLIAGGKRHLDLLPDFTGERLVLTGDLPAALARLKARNDLQRVVLASGDPLFFGIGKLLLEHFPREELLFLPHLSSVQLAFARIKESWQDARVVSVHGRALETLRPVLVEGAAKIAVLTDPHNTPAAVARLVREVGHSYLCWVCEDLGSPAERVRCLPLEEVERETYSPLNVVVLLTQASGGRQPPGPVSDSATNNVREYGKLSTEVLSQESGGRQPPGPMSDSATNNVSEYGNQSTDEILVQGADAPRSPGTACFGIPDDEFASVPAGMVTRREVRLIALSYLALQAGDVLWDIGTGSGSISIEAGRWLPTLRVFAIERSAAALEQARANAARFAVGNITFVAGAAPAALAGLPTPQAVFIGGSGGQLDDILAEVAQQLAQGGRLVLNCVTLECFTGAWNWLTAHDWQVSATQVQLARTGSLGRFHSLEPDRPVTIIVAQR